MVSTAARTLETWQLVRPCCLGQPVEIIDPSLYLASARQLLSRIRETPSRVSSVLAIGHNPGMHELALRLAESGVGNDAASLTEKFPTGALAVFSFKERPWADISAARLTLEHFVQPRELTQTV